MGANTSLEGCETVAHRVRHTHPRTGGLVLLLLLLLPLLLTAAADVEAAAAIAAATAAAAVSACKWVVVSLHYYLPSFTLTIF